MTEPRWRKYSPHDDAHTLVSANPQSHTGLNHCNCGDKKKKKRQRNPLLLYLEEALREFPRLFYFWLAEKVCCEKKYSKRFSFSFFFCWDQEMLLAENKWWSFFFFFLILHWLMQHSRVRGSSYGTFIIIFWGTPRLLLQHLSQSTMCGDSLSTTQPSLNTPAVRCMGNFMDTMFPFVAFNCVREY